MGTRADFYIGRGKDARWLGSVAYDGYPESILDRHGLGAALTEETFRVLVAKRLAHDDGTQPEQGWPWPWKDSQTTDYAYAFDEGQVWVSSYYGWETVDQALRGEGRVEQQVEFPDMTDVQNVTFGPRSGILVFGLKTKDGL
jgi:hypothetical protein